MADDAADLIIRLRAEGAAQTTGEIEGVAGAVKDVGVASEQSGEIFDSSILRNRRSVGHLVRGITEIGEGGTKAIGGLGAELFVLSEGFEAVLGPVGWIIGALGLIASVAIPAMTKATKDTSDATKDAEDRVKGLDDATQRADASAKEAQEVHLKNLKDILTAQDQQIANEKLIDELNQKHLKNLEARVEASTKLIVAGLKLQEQSEVNNATSEQEIKLIHERYAAKIAEATGSGEEQKHQLELQGFADQKTELEKEQADLKADTAKSQAALDKLQLDAAIKIADAKTLGGVADPNTGSFKTSIDQMQKQIDGLVKADLEIPASDSIHKANQDNITSLSSDLARIKDAEAARIALQDQGAPLKADIAKNSTALEKLSGSLDDLATQLADANDAYKTALDDAEAKREAAQKASDNQAMEDNEKTRETMRETARTQLETQKDALAQSDKVGRAAIDIQIAQLTASDINDKRLTGIATGKFEAGSPEDQLAQAKYNQALAGAQGKVSAADTATDTKELHTSVEAATEQLKKVGSKDLVSAFDKMTAGATDAVKAAQLIADLATVSVTANQAIISRLQKAEAAIASLKTSTSVGSGQ